MKTVKITKREYRGDDELYGAFYKCPKCKQRSIMICFDYCPSCGAKLEFTKGAKDA